MVPYVRTVYGGPDGHSLLLLLSGITQEQADALPEMKMLRIIASIYEQEGKVKQASADERLAWRKKQVTPLALGRRNWLFCFSKEGARTSAVVYSLVETAKANDADPYLYLQYLFEQMPGHMEDTDYTFLKNMTPWSESYRAYEAARKAERMTFRFPEKELHPPEQRRSARKKPQQIA